MVGQRAPQLRRPAAVVEGEDAGAPKVVAVHEVVLVPQGDGVVPVGLAQALARGGAPGRVRLLPGDVVHVAVRRVVGDACIAVGGHRVEVGGRRPLGNRVRVVVGRARVDAGRVPVIGDAEDDLGGRHHAQVLGGDGGVVVAVGREGGGGAEAVARAVERRVSPVAVVQVVGHHEVGVGVGGEARDVEHPARVGGRAGVGGDGEVAARHRRPQLLHEAGGQGPDRRPAAAPVDALVVDVDPVRPVQLAEDLVDGVLGVDESGAETGVVLDQGDHDPGA